MPRCYKAPTSEIRSSIRLRSEVTLNVIGSATPSPNSSKYSDWWAGYARLELKRSQFAKTYRYRRWGACDIFLGSEILSGHTLLWSLGESEQIPVEGHMEDLLDVNGFKF
ncbi:hypothetical protein TWF730_008768 [Orbilia blumenaviensis]|uniref:Uncharacterized protein n=1 Tax=Orbilia blumenaviensis TaxID=1796055 RepID=A0AAV9V450_9PEZI